MWQRPLPPSGWSVAMDPATFEPFGGAVPLSGEAAARARGARWLVRAGVVLFWTIAIAIVIARALWFEPALFDGFGRAIAF